MCVCILALAFKTMFLPHLHWAQSQFSSRWSREWDLDLGIRDAAAIFITKSESVFKPQQIVFHLFKGKRCFLNRPERAWTKNYCGDFSIYGYLKGDSKIMPHTFQVAAGRSLWAYFICTLNPALQMPVGGGVGLTAGLGIWDLEFQILVRLCHLSAMQSKVSNLIWVCFLI